MDRAFPLEDYCAKDDGLLDSLSTGPELSDQSNLTLTAPVFLLREQHGKKNNSQIWYSLKNWASTPIHWRQGATFPGGGAEPIKGGDPFSQSHLHWYLLTQALAWRRLLWGPKPVAGLLFHTWIQRTHTHKDHTVTDWNSLFTTIFQG